MEQPLKRRWAVRILQIVWRALPYAVLMWLAGMTALLVVGTRESPGTADVVVVLGNEVDGQGRLVPRTAARADRAAELYAQRRVDWIIVSGGVGASGVDEATAMRDHLVRGGVPQEHILVDSNGVNTRQTVDYVRRTVATRGWTRVAVASQFFHQPRTVLALRQCGVAQVLSTPAAHLEWRDVYSATRELPALLVYALRGCTP
jgi:vancomycin permeability regulator SanA